jgi:hypothetical protein
MNRNDFLQMIEEKVPVNRQVTGEVYELIDIFPYFQSAHMLLLKGLQNNDDIKFEKQLRNSALLIADREVLYYFLKTRPLQKAESGELNQVETSLEDTGSDTEQTVIESAKNSEYLIDEIERTTNEGKSEKQTDSVHQIPVHSILISSESDEEESAGIMLLDDEEPEPLEEKSFYMDPGFSISDHKDLLELDLGMNEVIVSVEGSMKMEQMDYNIKNTNKQSQSELIDNFIIANPRIEPVKEKSTFLLNDISKKGTDEEGGFVTETLARIYINQGYYSKAIFIYEKLSLKFPEKSSYFASQIEKVKEYINK